MAERVRHASGWRAPPGGERQPFKAGGSDGERQRVASASHLSQPVTYFDHNLSYRTPNEAWFEVTEPLKSPLQLSCFKISENLFLRFSN